MCVCAYVVCLDCVHCIFVWRYIHMLYVSGMCVWHVYSVCVCVVYSDVVCGGVCTFMCIPVPM